MKTVQSVALFAVVSILLGSAAGATELPETVPVPVNHVYVPNGFDTNDDSQVVVSGYLPNLCYKSPKTRVRVSDRTVSITVVALKDKHLQFCPMMVVPFLETVSVGTLTRGAYRVVVNGNQHARLGVVDATQAATDDHVYANVEYVEKTIGDRRISLKGYNPSDCFELDRVEYVSNRSDTYSVLPIMKQVRANCPRKMTPFSIETEVPRELSADEVLLHVRVMGGKSVNTLLTDR